MSLVVTHRRHFFIVRDWVPLTVATGGGNDLII